MLSSIFDCSTDTTTGTGVTVGAIGSITPENGSIILASAFDGS